MNKEYKIKLDLNKKLYNKKMAFNQFDENVNDFYIEVTKNNEVVKDLDKSIVTLVAIKPNGEVDAQFIEVKEGQIYADLKPSMCDLVGNYQAKAIIALEGEIVTTDTINYSVNEDKIISKLNDDVVSDERFTLFTDALARLSDIEASEEQRMINEAERILAEENRKIEEAKRVEAELIRQHEEADRAKYDATRESNENIRKQNESIRLTNETNRIDEEVKRVEEENKRKLAEEERNANYNFMTEDEERRRSEANAHKEAEVLRVQAETNRVNEEAKRRTTEQARVSAENTRVNNENTRKANEETRQSNEAKRVEAETQRQSRYNSFITDAEANANNFENYTNTVKVKEEERKANELDRKSQETQRVSNEVERISNENTRKANEKARESNEISRQNVFEDKVDEFNEKIVELNTTKENFVSSINTKVDTKISELNTTKDNFVSSVNTKVDNKISELDNAKSDMTNTVSNKVNEVETRFNALTSSQQQSSEVIDARDGETSLKARLDRDIEKAKQVYVNVEGSHISTDSNVGYAKDVEILGNTIQDASNLADIRSVGDKVEGQELYEIPVVSCGKNLFNPEKILSFDSSGGNVTSTIITSTTNENIKGYLFKVNGSETITITKSLASSRFRAFWFVNNPLTNSNEISIGGTYADSTNKMRFTVDANARYVYVVLTDLYSTQGIGDVQIEEGTVATPYEPYQEDKLTILSPVQLEKIGDVRDRIIEKDGVWGVEKNVRTILLDGSESDKYAIESSTWYDDTTYAFHYKVSGYNISTADNSKQMIICDKLISNSADYVMGYDKSTPMICGHSNGFAIFRLKRESLDDFTKGSLCKFLSSNNMCIKYPTKQPQFIPLPHDQQIKLRTFANKTNISFLTEIEGTIKAQVPKSLGATVNTHTEQINNLNKELDRVKKLEESTVSTVTTESDFTTVEATSNGYFEDVKLEGKTLVVNSDNEVVESGTDGAMLKSVGEDVDEISVESMQNLLDYTKLVNKVTDGTTGVVKNEVSRLSLEIDNRIEVFSTNIFVKYNNLAVSIIGFTEKNGTPIYDSGYLSSNTVTLPSNTKYITVNVKRIDGSANISKEEAKKLLIYHQSDKKCLLYYNEETQAWEKPILRQWDSIEKHADGKYYYHKRSEEVVLNGSENWKISTSSLENRPSTSCFNLLNLTIGDNVLNDKFKVVNNLELTNIDYEVLDNFHGSIWINIYKSKLTTDDVNGFKQWLQANNVTVVYQLAQEKVYECTNIDLITYANETNYVIESGAIVPRTTLKVHNNISNVVSLLQKKVSLLESNITSYMITQNRLMLASRYNADTVSFKVDVATLRNSFEYDNDLYELILNNVLVGKDNYNREYIENLIIFYWMDFIISDEMYSTLFEIIEEQHNPKIIEEETPLI